MSPKPLVLVVGLALTSATSMSVSAAGAIADGLFEAAAAGATPVIIELNVQVAPEATLAAASGEAAVDAQRASIAEAQQAVLKALSIPDGPAAEGSGVKLYQFVPMMALSADAAMLKVLQASPQVKSVVADEISDPIAEPADGSSAEPPPSAPLLSSSIVVVGSNIANDGGISGGGATVAVLDTGVQKTHPFLSGAVVSEACYSSNTSSSTTVCPGGVQESTATGSGVNCNVAISGCNHGTHVAGIVAGRRGVSGAPTSGVAPSASIIAVQVFSQFSTGARSWTSDQIKGLERVYALRNTYNIAAVNMSLGGGRYFSACDSDPRKPIIDQLRAAGIATVISSGNDGFRDSVGAPGCISTAMTVGATDDSDAIAGFSNIDDTIDFLAPGVSVVSSVPLSGGGSGYSSFDGTSMAAPHVAGAFALFRQLDSLASVSEIQGRLAGLSVQVNDNRSSGVQTGMDRIALAWMGNGRCWVTGRIKNNWGYDSGSYRYVSVAPRSSYGTDYVFYARVPNNSSLSQMVAAAVGGQSKDPAGSPTVTIRGTGPCPTSGTLRYIYTGDYGFMTNGE